MLLTDMLCWSALGYMVLAAALHGDSISSRGGIGRARGFSIGITDGVELVVGDHHVGYRGGRDHNIGPLQSRTDIPPSSRLGRVRGWWHPLFGMVLLGCGLWCGGRGFEHLYIGRYRLGCVFLLLMIVLVGVSLHVSVYLSEPGLVDLE